MNNLSHYRNTAAKTNEPSLFDPKLFESTEENILLIKRLVDDNRWKEAKWCESFTERFVDEIKECKVFVDIGAEIGFYTYLALKNMPPGGKIYAFEPDPVKYVLLSKFYHGYKHVTIYDFAISDKKDIVEFVKPAGQSATFADVNGEKFFAKTITLDEILAGESPDVIKMDIEGSEAHAFVGMTHILQKGKPKLFLELHYWVDEIYPNGTKMMEKLLQKNGYMFYNTDSNSMEKISQLKGVRLFITHEKLVADPVKVEILEKVHSHAPPIKIDELILNYTSFCNGRCTYCTIWKNKNAPELDADTFENIFSASQLANLNSCYVTGGEPYYSDKVLDIASIMHKYIPSSMLTGATNGLLMTKTLERALKIRDMGIKMQLQVSMNGTRDTHDRTRGREGSWDKVVKLIDKLTENGIDTCPAFSMMPQTIADLPFMKLFCQLRNLPMEIAWVRQSSRYDEVDSQFTHWPEIIRSGLKYVEDLPDYFDCPSLKRRLNINPDGTVYPCEVYVEELYLGNINERSLEDILNDSRSREVNEFISQRKCHWCQGSGLLEGNPKWMVMDCYRRQSPQGRSAINKNVHALYADPKRCREIIDQVLAPVNKLRPESVESSLIPLSIMANRGRKEKRLLPIVDKL